MQSCGVCSQQGKQFKITSRSPLQGAWFRCEACDGVGVTDPDYARLVELGRDVTAARHRYGRALADAASLLELSIGELIDVEGGRRAPPRNWLYLISGGREISDGSAL